MDVFVERNLDMDMANEYFNECRNLETGKYEGKMASLIKDSTEFRTY